METPTRDQLDESCVEHVRAAGGTRPDLKVVNMGEHLAVLKDYRGSDPLFRDIVGPILIRRERGALRRLAGVDGVPRLVRTIDRHALLIEHIEGTTLGSVERNTLRPEFFSQLEDLIRRMHAAGIAHCDLRNGGNLLVGDDSKPYIIDFASCVFRGRGLNPLMNLIFREFQRADLYAVLLAKKSASPALLTPEDEARIARSLPFERPAIFIGQTVRNLTRRLLTRRRQ